MASNTKDKKIVKPDSYGKDKLLKFPKEATAMPKPPP